MLTIINGEKNCLPQINHKYPERRLLVAESCGALAPYLPVSVLYAVVVVVVVI